MKSLEMLVYKLIREGDVPIRKLARLLGVSENYLYKMSLPEMNENWSDIPCRKLIAIGYHQKSDDLPKFMAREFGGVFVKIPRAARDRRDRNKIISNYQATTTGAVRSLIDYFERPNEENYDDLLEKIEKVMSKSEGIRRRARKDGFQQMELFEKE